MDLNYNTDFGNIPTITNFVILDETNYQDLINNVNCNSLLILFTLSCMCTLLCCSWKNNKHEYKLIHNVDAVPGEVIEKV